MRRLQVVLSLELGTTALAFLLENHYSFSTVLVSFFPLKGQYLDAKLWKRLAYVERLAYVWHMLMSTQAQVPQWWRPENSVPETVPMVVLKNALYGGRSPSCGTTPALVAGVTEGILKTRSLSCRPDIKIAIGVS